MHRVELEIAEKAIEPLRAAIEIEVVAKARECGGVLDPRLLRVDLPGMDVENEFLLLRVQLAQRPAGETVGKQPEISAARDGNLGAAVAQHRYRKFDQASAAGRGEDVRRLLRVGYAVAVVAHREDARVVAEALFAEDVERPQRAARYRIRRRAVACHGPLREILEQRLGVARLLLELGRRLCVDETMAHAVRRHLVSRGRDLAYDLRVLARDPAENEKSRANL